MNGNSGCWWAFAACMFLGGLLVTIGVPSEVVIGMGVAIVILLVVLLLRGSGEAAPPSQPEKPPRRQTSARTTRQSPRPHWRRAHRHSYWTGSRKDPDQRTVITRWIDETYVGGGSGPRRRRPTSSGRQPTSSSRQSTGRNSSCPHCGKRQRANVMQSERYCAYCGKLDCKGHIASHSPAFCQFCGALTL